MLMPDPDNERKRLNISEFLASIESPKQRKKFESLLAHLEPLSNVISARFPAPDGIPQLRIVKNAPIEATELGDLTETIYLTDGLLNDCLAVEDKVATLAGLTRTPKPFGKLSIAKVAFMWAYAHECFHFLRRHALVEKHFGSDISTKHAIEYDADMCSVAMIYRYLQKIIKKGDEFQIKRAVLMNLYWTLRIRIEQTSISDFSGSNTHPYIAARLLDSVGKLAIMNDTGVPDPNFGNPKSRIHGRMLFEIVCHLDIAYLKAFKNLKKVEIEDSLFAEFVRANNGLVFTGHRARRWDEISKLIDSFSILPRNLVDNEKSIAFVVQH